MTTDQRGTTGRGPGEGRSPLPGQHDEAAAESSAGRSTSTRDPHERSSDGQGAGTTSPAGAASSPRSRDKGGDRRGARRQARGHRLTVRLDDEEAGQVADLAERYGISGAGVFRAGVAVLAGAPVPQPPNVDLLAVRREVNALGVNVHQIARRVNGGERVVAVELQQMVDVLHELVRRWSS